MKTRLINLWDAFRGGFLFIPTIFVAFAVTLAIVVPQLDDRFAAQILAYSPGVRMQPDTARSTLSSIAGAIITVTGVVFSITVVALSIASSQFGSRLLRIFMNDQVTQMTIGYLVGSSVYCFLLLSIIQSNVGLDGVPHAAVQLGIVGGISSFAVMIYFIHHVAKSIHVTTIVNVLGDDLDASIMRLFPANHDDPAEDVSSPPQHDDEQRENTQDVTIHADREGYIQGIDMDTVTSIAKSNRLIVRLRHRPGNFLVRDAPLADVSASEEVTEDDIRELNDAIIVGSRRTPRQDVECAVHELVEVAVRALSPGINDPFTANSCIDRLGAALSRLARRRMLPPERYDGDGYLRVVVPAVTFPDVVDAAFHQIRQNSTNQVSVVVRLLENFALVVQFTDSEQDTDAIVRHAHLVRDGAKAEHPHPEDAETIDERFTRVLEAAGIEQE